MGTPTKILIVENNPTDIEFLQNELNRSGVRYTSEVVQTESGYRTALKDFIPHIILSDFALPAFNGDAAFEIRRLMAPETPFIFVSGTIGDEKSIEYIKNGVTDYVLKDKLFTLNVKIKRALNDVKEKEQKTHAEDALKKSEKFFRALIERSKDMIFLINREGDLVYGSPYISAVFGYSADEFAGMNIYDVIHPEDTPDYRHKRAEILKTPGDSFDFQHRRKHKNGNWVWCEGTVTNLLNEPSINALITNFRDVSLRKQAELELLSANRLQQATLNDLQKIMDSSLDIICSIDEERKFVSVSEAANSIWGYKPAELVGRNFIDFVAKDDVEKTLDTDANILSGFPVTVFENSYIHKNGKIVPMLWSSNWDGSDKITYCIAKDITEKKIAERKLFDSETRLKEAQAIAHTGNFEMDVEDYTEVWSDEMFTNLGIKKHGATPSMKLFLSFVHPDDAAYMQTGLEECLRTLEGSAFNFKFIRKDGGLRYGYSQCVFELEKNNKPLRIFGIFQDVTEIKLAEIEREKLVHNLRLRNDELEQFAYVASHDLQEPLRMVTSFMGQLERRYGDVIDERGKQYINFAVDGAKRMRLIILDLLDFSRVGKKEDQTIEIDFNNLVNEVLVLYRKRIDEVNGKIVFNGLPTLHTYKAPLKQVFQNLISNSLKYHKTGEAPVIEIACNETASHFQFSVKDNGIGISAEYFDKIFIIFQRLHNKDEYSGTGMGLAIVKKIVENLGGKVWVESREGVGSTFHFTLIKKL
jgi:PAS domain S-box-containing protein